MAAGGEDKDLFWAVQSRDFEGAFSLLFVQCGDANSRDDAGWTPLHLAAHMGNFDIASLLLDYGADPNVRSPDDSTPLHYAAQSGQDFFKIAQELIENFADVNVKDTSGSTPLHKAAQRQSIAVVKLLLDSNADYTARDRYGSMPIDYAKDGDVASLLRGEKLSYRRSDLMTPMFSIMINGNPLNESTKSTANAPKTHYIIVQCRSSLDEEERKDLGKEGLEFHDYICKNTYLCKYRKTNMDRLCRMEPIVYVDIYRAQFKVHTDLSELLASGADSRIIVRIIFHCDVDAETEDLQDRIARASKVDRKYIEFYARGACLAVRGTRLHKIAAIDKVCRIEKEPRIQLMNDRARTIMGCDTVPEPSTLRQTNYQGDGQVIAVADTGLDYGPGKVHDTFQGRIVGWDALYTCKRDEDSHGTHVCASAVGNGMYKGRRVMGTAPRALLFVQSMWNPSISELVPPKDLNRLFSRAYFANCARVHSNSWGTIMEKCQPARTDQTDQIDDFVWNHKDMVVCFAAGNAGFCNEKGETQLGQIGGHASAKNCITVGASENERPNAGVYYGQMTPHLPNHIFFQPMAEDRSNVAVFSSRGPPRRDAMERTLIKPDLVAPGTQILSRSSLARLSPPQWPCPDDHQWCYSSGTSMATALVAGCAAVLREALKKHYQEFISAALIKALLINGAEILSPDGHPDYHSGFGRVNAANSLSIACGDEGTGFREHKFSKDSKQFTTEVLLRPEHTAFKVTLVWTDPPGNLLKNQLRLVLGYLINKDGPEKRMMPKFYYNNVQQVLHENVFGGRLTISVNFKKLKTPLQPFTVVWRLFH